MPAPGSARSVVGVSEQRPTTSTEEGATTVVQVRCGPRGEWFVQEGRHGDPLSWHTSESEAEQAALDHVRAIGGGHVVVRDRYHRDHANRRPTAREA